jgi:hypothetical protein
VEVQWGAVEVHWVTKNGEEKVERVGMEWDGIEWNGMEWNCHAVVFSECSLENPGLTFPESFLKVSRKILD